MEWQPIDDKSANRHLNSVLTAGNARIDQLLASFVDSMRVASDDSISSLMSSAYQRSDRLPKNDEIDLLIYTATTIGLSRIGNALAQMMDDRSCTSP